MGDRDCDYFITYIYNMYVKRIIQYEAEDLSRIYSDKKEVLKRKIMKKLILHNDKTIVTIQMAFLCFLLYFIIFI